LFLSFFETKSRLGGLIECDNQPNPVISGETSICDILQSSPLALEILLESGLQQAHIAQCTRLEEAARSAGIPLPPLLLALNRELHPTSFDGGAYLGLETGMLLALLRNQHHDFIDKRLPRLELLARRLQNELPAALPVLPEITHLLLQLKASLAQHILEEQDELFSYVELLLNYIHKNLGRAALTEALGKPSPIHHLVRGEEDDLLFENLRRLTLHYHPPVGAGLMLRHLYTEMERLEHDLREHENAEFEILLGQVLALENEALARLQA